ncbi:MAG TPA: SDR family oxidoreductase [Streptosporangiaceae bacterium]|jgi:NAD(P)-dependent dehydrogenase (short-subunit alcohol dehydrogenase family)
MKVLVTGAGGGIGSACARAFAATGDTVAGVDLRAEPLDRLAAELPGTPVRTADLRDPAVLGDLVDWAWDALGGVDALVNAGGLFPAKPLRAVTADDWDTVVGVNARTPLLLTNALAERLIAAGRGGHVVNISSGAGVRPRPGTSVYAASKAALNMVTKASALELAAYGIRVNAVAPGYVRVGSEVNPVAPAYEAAIAESTPAGRVGTPDDIARVVRWLCAPGSAWLTGAIVPADGGLGLGSPHTPTWS